MSAETASDPKFEIGHVLFIDMVGYSKLNIDDQTSLLRDLTKTVQETEQFRRSEAQGKLVCLPTGDGMVLVFRDSAESPAQCAFEASRTLQRHGRLPVRMGIHSGPVNELNDVNNRLNLAGAGINIAQRVMDCGDAGHILLSKRAAEDLEHYSRWQSLLHDLGDVEVKHGGRIGVVNLYFDGIGNSELPEKIKKSRRQRKVARQKRFLLGALLLMVALLITWAARQQLQKRESPVGAIPQKSIAVLPFVDLSKGEENFVFAEGVQDEILNDLAKLADLKVISRTSVMQYKAEIRRNLREIGQALGVAHIVEGTVQRAGDRVRVSAQLIDAKSDNHLWAEHYDRPLNDVFAVQSEIAEKIAGQLQAKLSPREKVEIERQPTSDIGAFDLYTRGKALLQTISLGSTAKDNLLQGIELLNQAVARDPAFFDAYCQLGLGHDLLYFFGLDHTETRRLLAESAVRTAVRLRPDAGETHLAQADYLYRCYLDYNRARPELEIAARLLPNRPLVFMEMGSINRRHGRWQDCLRNFEKALELDPQNVFPLQQIALAHQYLRQFPEMARALDRALALMPNDVDSRSWRALIELDWKADPKPLHETIHSILSENPAAAESLTDLWLYLAFCERDPVELAHALTTHPSGATGRDAMKFPRAWWEGLAARTRGDANAATAAFTSARIEMERDLREKPEYGPFHSMLGMIYAGLGLKEPAIREGERALELLPVEKDSINGAHVIEFLATIYAWTGENDRAIAQLFSAINTGGLISYGQLRLHPYWDPLRGDPRFEQLVEEAKKPVAIK